jgi:hypothetical protein
MVSHGQGGGSVRSTERMASTSWEDGKIQKRRSQAVARGHLERQSDMSYPSTGIGMGKPHHEGKRIGCRRAAGCIRQIRHTSSRSEMQGE